jgi:hypothetical protein
MADTKSLREQLEEAGEKIGKAADDTIDAFRKSSAGKEILGEDGKLEEDDLKRLGDKAKDAWSDLKDKAESGELKEQGKKAVNQLGDALSRAGKAFRGEK